MVCHVNTGIAAVLAVRHAIDRLEEEDSTNKSPPRTLEQIGADLRKDRNRLNVAIIAGSAVFLALTIGFGTYGWYLHREFNKTPYGQAQHKIEQAIPDKDSYIGVRYVPSKNRTGIIYLNGDPD